MNLKFFLYLFIIYIFSGCGQNLFNISDSGNFIPNSNIVTNSLFLNVKNELTGDQNSWTQFFFRETTGDINIRIKEDVLFRSNYRPTKVQFGELSKNVLGLTQCEYYNNGFSQCTITISNTINPDLTEDELLRSYKLNTFVGVIRHEIGHAFGMGHVKDSDVHVMYPYFKNIQLQETSVQKFIEDIDNFRKNGAASGLPTIEFN